MITLRVHPDCEPLRIAPGDMEKMQRYFAGHDMEVRYYPRSLARDVTGIDLPPYSYRAVTRGPISYVFLDDTETPKSVAWITCHELTHQLLRATPQVKRALMDGRPTDAKPWDDRYHRLDPEERLADGVATRLIGQRLDRDWWRARTPVQGESFGRTQRQIHFSGCIC